MNTALQPETKQHIAIVGGGMVGISLALLLKKTLSHLIDHDLLAITLIEQFSFDKQTTLQQPSFDDRSTALSAGTADILQSIDCWNTLIPHASPIKTVHISDKGHFNGAQLHAENMQREALGYVVENKQLGYCLVQQLQQQKIDYLAPAKVKQCLPKKEGYQLQITTDTQQTITLHTNLLIIADGSDSPLRKQLGIDIQQMDYQQSALIANVAVDRDHQSVAYERFTDEGPIALLPLTPLNHQYRSALVWTLPQEKVSEVTNMDAATLCEKLQSRFGYRIGRIQHIGQHSIYPLAAINAQEQVRSHLALVGNAAHFLHPVAGQGFNLAIRDCVSLATCLAKQNPHETFGSYPAMKRYLKQQQMDHFIFS